MENTRQVRARDSFCLAQRQISLQHLELFPVQGFGVFFAGNFGNINCLSIKSESLQTAKQISRFTYAIAI